MSDPSLLIIIAWCLVFGTITFAIAQKKNLTGLAWWFVPAVLPVPAMVLGGFVARRWEWRFPIVETWNPLLPAVLALGAFLVFFFAALDSSPFIYFQF